VRSGTTASELAQVRGEIVGLGLLINGLRSELRAALAPRPTGSFQSRPRRSLLADQKKQFDVGVIPHPSARSTRRPQPLWFQSVGCARYAGAFRQRAGGTVMMPVHGDALALAGLA
jgi:hypothetical protein